jgi:hypothetical protein
MHGLLVLKMSDGALTKGLIDVEAPIAAAIVDSKGAAGSPLATAINKPKHTTSTDLRGDMISEADESKYGNYAKAAWMS